MKSLAQAVIMLLMVLTIFLSSCYYDVEEVLYPDNLTCNITNVDFQIDIKPIIEANCATSGCHVPGTGRKDLSTDKGILDIKKDGRLEEFVLIRKDMPPSQPLSSCNQAYIKEWLTNSSSAN